MSAVYIFERISSSFNAWLNIIRTVNSRLSLIFADITLIHAPFSMAIVYDTHECNITAFGESVKLMSRKGKRTVVFK